MSKLVDSLKIHSFDIYVTHADAIQKIDTRVVKVKDLEAALEKLPVVYGVYDDELGLVVGSKDRASKDTHTARLLCIEEIKREPLKHEFETEAVSNNQFGKLYTNMIPSSFVGKKVRVTVEELR